MGFVDKWSLRMQGQWVFSKAGGQGAIFGRAHKLWIFWTCSCPCPNLPHSKSLCWERKFTSFLGHLQRSKVPTPQDPLCILKAIKCLGTSLAWWAHNLMKANKTGDEIAQAYTPTQRHVNNGWSEMISCSPCFGFHCFSYFLGAYKQYGIIFIPLRLVL